MEAADNALNIARGQFAITIGFHIVLAAFSIGLANFLMALEALSLWRKDQAYMDLYKFWVKIFALNVAVGTASGLVMEFEFGTNWGGLATRAGAIIGPLMFFEVMVAFFLEAGFLGIMLFGLKKVGPKLHFFATCAVAVGSLFSAFWILSANSWMHSPAGYTVSADGRFLPADWFKIVFNPSFPYRLVHMTLAAFIGTAFMVGAAGAWHLLRDPGNRRARIMFSLAMWVAAIAAPLQIVAGDLHGEKTLELQPQKLAAMEGAWDSPAPGEGEPLRLFALPDMDAQRNRFEVALPHIGSLYLRHSWTGTIAPLKAFPKEDLPPVPIVFFAFRLMVGLGVLMAAVGIASLVVRKRGRLYTARWLHKTVLLMAPAGFIAMLSGWVVTEVGRQPFTVYGLLRTVDSASPATLSFVQASAIGIVGVYVIVFGIGLIYLIRAMGHTPEAGEEGPEPELASDTGQ